MPKENPMFAALQKADVVITAIAGDMHLAAWPKVIAKPEFWNLAWPGGAMLEMRVDLPPFEGKEPVTITAFELRVKQLKVDVIPPAPIVLEPYTQMQLNRFLVVPKWQSETDPETQP